MGEITNGTTLAIQALIKRETAGPPIPAAGFNYYLLLPPGFEYVHSTAKFDNNDLAAGGSVFTNTDPDGIPTIITGLTYPADTKWHIISWDIKTVSAIPGPHRIVGKLFGSNTQLHNAETYLEITRPRPVFTVPSPGVTLPVETLYSIISGGTGSASSQQTGEKKTMTYGGNWYSLEKPPGVIDANWRGIIEDSSGQEMSELFDKDFKIYDRNGNLKGSAAGNEMVLY